MPLSRKQLRELYPSVFDFDAEELFLYNHHLKELKHPVRNLDGSVSTVKQMTIELNGRVYSLPTIWDGKELSFEEAIKRAQKTGLDKFPSYTSEQEAQKRYDQLHMFMEQDIQKKLEKENQEKSRAK